MTSISATPSEEPNLKVRSALRDRSAVLWFNPARLVVEVDGSTKDIRLAARRFSDFALLLATAFPQLEVSGGYIDSPLLEVDALSLGLGIDSGRLLVKADHLLPVGGSVKARGGTHAVLAIAERVLRTTLGTGANESLSVPNISEVRATFSHHSVSVGSTGNLGLSVGTLAAAFGFQAVVHMSSEAKEWKKRLLTERGARVIEHQGDYESALIAGRSAALANSNSHFIDDEDSWDLMVGYATAAADLKRQLAEMDVAVDEANPLFVYLPCGVGGAPAGITLGLHHAFGKHVHCFFGEPTEAPCVLLQLLGNVDARPSVHDLGLTGKTVADGLAVARASLLAAKTARGLIAGSYTVDDATMLRHLYLAGSVAGMRLEPSAAAAFQGVRLLSGQIGRKFLERCGSAASIERVTHVAWTTGGSFVPEPDYARLLARGRASVAASPSDVHIF